MPFKVRRLRASGLCGNGQGPAFVGLEKLGHYGVRIVVLDRFGADKPEVGIEGDQAAIEGAVVEGNPRT